MKHGSGNVMDNLPLVKVPCHTTNCLKAGRQPFISSGHPDAMWQRECRSYTCNGSVNNSWPVTHHCMALTGMFQNNSHLAGIKGRTNLSTNGNVPLSFIFLSDAVPLTSTTISRRRYFKSSFMSTSVLFLGTVLLRQNV